MNEKMKKQLIGYMLHHKEHGYSVLYILRKSAIRYVILLGFLAFCLLLNRKGYLVGGALFFLTGLVIGAIARDVGWIRQSKKVWPLYVDVIDWGRVKVIADSKTDDHTSDSIRHPSDGSPKPSR